MFNKLLDLIILNAHREKLDTCELQFGFKSKHSTTQCTFVLNEVAQYYTNHNTSVFVMLPDCSKAFDRVEYVKLFALLRKRGICPIIIRLLLFTYINQSLCVSWGRKFSRDFSVSNGVKQGGILSPVLFTVYINVLLTRLKDSGVGCYIGTEYFGTLCYADDIALLTPSVKALKTMQSICDEFGDEYNVLINATKIS